MDFWWICYSGEARGLVFWAMDPVWSPPQAPGVSCQIWGPTWVKNRSWTSFLSHLEALGVSKMDSQCIFGPDWARQSSERPQNGPKRQSVSLNRAGMIKEKPPVTTFVICIPISTALAWLLFGVILHSLPWSFNLCILHFAFAHILRRCSS